MKDVVPDFGLGETLKGQNTDVTPNVDLNTALEGRTYEFPVTESVATALNMPKRVVGQRIVAKIMKNTTGSAVLPKELVTIDLTGGFEALGRASADASADDRFAYIVDPSLPAAGCADQDLFYAIVEGPTIVKLNSTSHTGGDILKVGGLYASAITTETAELHLGTALETVTSATEVKIYMKTTWG